MKKTKSAARAKRTSPPPCSDISRGVQIVSDLLTCLDSSGKPHIDGVSCWARDGAQWLIDMRAKYGHMSMCAYVATRIDKESDRPDIAADCYRRLRLSSPNARLDRPDGAKETT